MRNTKSQNAGYKVDYANLIEQAIKEPGVISGCFSLFHDYSLLNSMHVAWQQVKRFGKVTPIKGFRAWNDLNRKVKKGEKAIEVLFPIMSSFPAKDENGEIKKDKDGKPIYIKYVKGFTPKHIHFAYSQTEVLDPNKTVKDREIKDTKFNYELACKGLGITIEEYASVDGNCQGYARPKENVIAINPVAANPVKTAIHEIAHCLLHKERKYAKEIREVQAELTNYIVLSMIGASETTLKESRGYIQGWLKQNELTDEISKEVINAANKILEYGLGKKRA